MGLLNGQPIAVDRTMRLVAAQGRRATIDLEQRYDRAQATRVAVAALQALGAHPPEGFQARVVDHARYLINLDDGLPVDVQWQQRAQALANTTLTLRFTRRLP